MIEKVSSSDGMRVVCASCSVKSNLLYGGRKISPSSGIIDGLVFSDLILSERCYLELSSGFGFECNEIEMGNWHLFGFPNEKFNGLPSVVVPKISHEWSLKNNKED